jgi:hypothetical protein
MVRNTANKAEKLSLETIFNSTDQLSELIKKRFFILQRPKNKDQYFLTSDNASVLISHSNYEPASLTSLYTEISFPLSPSYSLSLLPQIICDDLFNKDIDSIKEIREAVLEKKPLMLEVDNVIYLNSIQVNQSKRFIYSNNNIKEYLDNTLKIELKKKEYDSLIKIGNESLRANVRENLHVVLYLNNYYYDFDIIEYITSNKNMEVVLVLKSGTLDKYLGFRIPQLFIYENKYPVIMIRNVVLENMENDKELFYYRIIPEVNIEY